MTIRKSDCHGNREEAIAGILWRTRFERLYACHKTDQVITTVADLPLENFGLYSVIFRHASSDSLFFSLSLISSYLTCFSRVPASFLLALLFQVLYLYFCSSNLAVCIFFILFLLSLFVLIFFSVFSLSSFSSQFYEHVSSVKLWTGGYIGAVKMIWSLKWWFLFGRKVYGVY